MPGVTMVHSLQELSDSSDFPFIVSGAQAVITTGTEQDLFPLCRQLSLPVSMPCLSHTYSNKFSTTTRCCHITFHQRAISACLGVLQAAGKFIIILQ